MDEDISLQYKVELKEYLLATSYYNWWSSFENMIVNVIFFVLGPFLGIFFWYDAGFNYWYLVMIFFPVIFPTVAVMIGIGSFIFYYKKNPVYKNTVTLKFCEKGVNYKMDHFESNLGWPIFQKVR
ncbi:MAG: hypothetical protein KC684_00360, partial [Candidatus Omnitrophica bacterium]|nr:hypothetical protein [Candidatus Omnitrophota bacterium]